MLHSSRSRLFFSLCFCRSFQSPCVPAAVVAGYILISSRFPSFFVALKISQWVFQKYDFSGAVTCVSGTCQRSFPYLVYWRRAVLSSGRRLYPPSLFTAWRWLNRTIISRLSVRRRSGGQRPLALGGVQIAHAMIAHALLPSYTKTFEKSLLLEPSWRVPWCKSSCNLVLVAMQSASCAIFWTLIHWELCGNHLPIPPSQFPFVWGHSQLSTVGGRLTTVQWTTEHAQLINHDVNFGEMTTKCIFLGCSRGT